MIAVAKAAGAGTASRTVDSVVLGRYRDRWSLRMVGAIEARVFVTEISSDDEVARSTPSSTFRRDDQDLSCARLAHTRA